MLTRIACHVSLAAAPLILVAPSLGQVQFVEVAEYNAGSWAVISPDGSTVAGYTVDTQGFTVSFRWTDSSGVVETRDPNFPSFSTVPFGVGSDGTVVGSGRDSQFRIRGVARAIAGPRVFMEAPVGAAITGASASSDSGHRSFGFSQSITPTRIDPAVWNDVGSIIEVVTSYTDGTAISGSFRACSGDGATALAPNGIWRQGNGVERLAVPVDAPFSSVMTEGLCLSYDGRYVFGLGNGLAARWDQQQATAEMLIPAPDGRVMTPIECTRSGEMAVGPEHLWRDEMGTVNFSEYAGKLAPDLGTYILPEVRGCSEDGTTVVGEGMDAGGVRRSWLIRFPSDWWTNEGTSYCGPAVANSSGDTARITAFGSTSITSNSLRLEVHGLPANSAGFFLASQTQGFVAMPGGSQGNLCVSGDIGRYVGPGQVLNSGTYERMLLQLDLNAMPSPTGFVAAQPGETWNFQLWHRDSVGGQSTSNFSDAVSVTLQ